MNSNFPEMQALPQSLTRLSCDFVVVGGGLAGVCAAVAAARAGARVVLIQDRSVLGGNASSEVKMHVVGADCHGQRPGARETGLMEELRLEDSFRNRQRSFSQWDLLLYEKVVEEKNITLLLNTTCTGCATEQIQGAARITAIDAVRHSTGERFHVEASFFADCSGDGVLGAAAGADFRIGREARSEFGEDKAVEIADTHTLGSSILFTARHYDEPQPFVAPRWVRRFCRDDFRNRHFDKTYEYGFWWSEWGGQLDTIADNDTIRHELLRIALGIWDYVKNSGAHPDSANWALDWVGAIPGKRESRRFLGPHILTQGDVESGRTFDDQVAYGGWWLDLHPPAGVDAPGEPACVQHHIPHLYGIPLRCLYSRNVGNLFFAGRNISATHVAFASTRVMGTCAAMGQAIGCAAALLRDSSGSIADLATPEFVVGLQQFLLRQDAYLLGIVANDPVDLSRSACCRADSEKPDAPAANLLNGMNRTVEAAWGPWAEAAGNFWESAALPAQINLEWAAPQKIKEIDLTFCTGLSRELMLTPSEHWTSRMTRGPQAETVRDYNLRVDGAIVAEIRGNYLRHRVHVLDAPVRGKALSVEILSTHGASSAKVFDLRVYGPSK